MNLSDLPDLPNCQIAYEKGGTDSLWASHRQRHADPHPTDSNRASCHCLQSDEASAGRQKHLLTWRNRGSLVSGTLSQEVRSWSALRSAGDVNKVYRNYDGRFRLHEETVTFSERSYVKHSLKHILLKLNQHFTQYNSLFQALFLNN